MASNPSQSDGNVAPTSDEEVIFYAGAPKLRGETGLVIICLALALLAALVPIGLKMIMPNTDLNMIAIPLWIAAPLILLLPLLLVKKNKYRISNYRIDHEQGLLSKRIDTIELWHVDDVRMDQSITDRILGVGTISIHSNDATSPDLKLRSLPNPRQIFDQVKQRVIAVKRQRGVLKIDGGGGLSSVGND